MASESFSPTTLGSALLEHPRRAEAILRAVFEADPGCLAIVAGSDPRFLWVNPAYRALLPTGADPVGRLVDDVWPPVEGFRSGAVLRDALLHRRVAVLPGVERRGDDGAVRTFTLHLRPVDLGIEPALLVVAWETTELEAARARAEAGERRARRHAAELDAIFRSLPNAITLHDATGVLVRMNPAGETLWGRIPPEVARLPAHDRLAALGARRASGAAFGPGETPIGRALGGEVVRGLDVEVQPHGPAARPRRVSLSAAPVTEPGGAIVGAVAVATDITALRDLEAAREDLLRTLSHDVRTPLTVVLTHAELLRRNPAAGPADVERRATAIAASARRIASMVNDLVDMAQLEAGRVRLSPRTFELREWALAVRGRLADAFPVERIEIDVLAGATVHADPDRLERVVVNLLTNALKYAPAGTPVVLAGGDERDHCVISVSDRGPGIPPDEIPRLFQRFYRSPAASAKPGIGLGLYVARLLTEAHGGRIEVRSELGQGATFRVLLPHAPPAP